MPGEEEELCPSGVNGIITFYFLVTDTGRGGQNKLVCLSLESFSGLSINFGQSPAL